MLSIAARRLRLGIDLGHVWGALGAVALCALFAYSTYLVHPAAFPAVLVLGSVAVLSTSRPEIGIAMGFVLIASSHLGLFPGPPWLLGASWATLLFVLALLRFHLEGRRLPVPPLSLAVLAYVAVTLFALSSADLGDAKPLIRSVITGALLFFAITFAVRTRRELHWVLAGAVVGGVLVSLYAAHQYRTGATADVGFITSSGELIGRVSAGFGQPNQLGGFLVILVPFALALGFAGRRLHLLWIFAAAAMIFGIYASYSRGALLGLAAIPLFFLRGRQVLVLVPVLVAALALATPGLLRERFSTLTAESGEVASRLDMWDAAQSIWAQDPLVGVGLGGFPEAYAEAQVPGKLYLPATIFEPPPHAHNLFLNQLAEQGVLGFAALFAVLLSAILLALSLRSSADAWVSLIARASLASLFAFLIHNQFDLTLLENTGVYFWGLLGVLSSLRVVEAAREREPEAAEQ